MTTAHLVNIVVIVIEVLANVLDLVLEIHVMIIPTADQANIVVIVVKVLLANVLDLVLENHVKIFSTADQVNLVVLMEHVH